MTEQTTTTFASDSADSDKPASARKTRPMNRPQFSIKTVLIVMTMTAVAVSCIAAPMVPAIVLLIVWPVVAVALLTTAIYGKGWIRPFAIAALLPQLFALFSGRFHHDFHGVLFALVIMYGMSILAGLAGSITHCYLSKRSGKVPVPNVPFLRNWLSNDD